MQAFGGEPLAKLRTKALIRPDPDDNRRSHPSLLRS
jgi:hypothetical protein